ncbi:MAG TPA: PAS domain S-box protein [Anaerolineales bacterium]|nr:PAS domain S-box protein [Anaerolineales bacterium]
MKADSKTKTARMPARSKTNKTSSNGKAAGKKPDRSVARPIPTGERNPTTKKVRRRAQEELVGTRQRLMATYEQAPIGIVECSLEGRHINVNQEFCRLTGYSREELLNRGIRDLTYEEDYIFDIKLHQRLVEGQIPYYKLEKRYVRKDGELIWVELTRNIMRDADGKGLFTIGAVVDVTERKRAEEALQLARFQAEQAADRIARLQEVTAALSEAVTPGQVAEIVVEQGGPALGAATGTVMLLVEDDETLEIVHTTSSETVTRPYQRFPISLNIPAADAARTGEPVWIESREQYLQRYPHLADQIAAWGRQAALASPMLDKGRTLGVLALSFDRPVAFTPEDQEYVLTLARQGAQALERARLFEAEQQARRAVMEFAGRQEVLYRLADQLHHTQSLEDVFAAALDAIFSALRCDRASILLYDDTNVMRFVAWRGLSDDYRRATEGHSPWRPDVKDPVPISIEDVGKAELDDSLKVVIQKEGIGSLAFIPLVSNGKLIGKFMVYFDRRHTISEAELDLSLTIARQLAFGIDRKRAEEALRASEERYRAVVESQVEMLCRFRRDGTILFVNGAYARARGSTPEELMRGNFWDFVAAEDRPGVEALLDSLTPEAPEVHIENRFQTVDGERWTLWTNRALSFDADGRVLEAQASGIDITERKRAEEALRESEARLRAVYDGTYEYIGLLSPDGTLLDANRASLEFGGDAREDVVGRPFWETTWWRYTPGAPEALRNAIERAAGGEFIRYEAPLQRPSGETMIFDFSLYPIHDEQGKVRFIVPEGRDITERKRAEEAVRASEERFVRFMQYLPGLAWIKDMQGRYVYVNDAAEKAFNTPRERLYGKTDEDIFPAEVAAQFKKNDEQALVDGNGIQVIETLEHEDGVVHYSLVSKFPIPGPDGSPALIGGTAFDITERRRAEDALRESEERYRNLFELVPVAVYTCDADGLIQEYNHRAVELWGREPRKNDPTEKYCGSSKLYYPDGRYMPHEACPMRRVLAGETLEPHELEVLVERPDGVRRNIIAQPLPLRDEHGEIVAAINCLYDITERKQAEQALQELNQQLENRVRTRTARLQAANQALREEIAEREQAEELLRRWAHIFEHADWGIATVYQDILTMVNPTYAKMHGYAVEELVGRNIYDIFAPDTHAEVQEQIRIAYERGHHIFESRHLRKDGSVFPVLVDTTVVRDEDGNVLYRAVNVQDITERKRVERELHESRERLQILSRRLVEVQEDERRAIARELHDRVGQTLAALNINLIIMNGQLSADSKELVGSRMDDSLKLVAETISLVRNVMTDLRPAVLDDYGLEAALQSYIDDYKSRYGIQVVLDPSDTPIPRLDPGLEMTLLRIGQEALTNVARHANAGQVRVSLNLIDHSIRLMVQDDGVGMDSPQGASSLKSHGLKIMRERAEAFGGTVTLESAPGKGTKVETRIPIRSGAQNKPPEEMHL